MRPHQARADQLLGPHAAAASVLRLAGIARPMGRQGAPSPSAPARTGAPEAGPALAPPTRPQPIQQLLMVCGVRWAVGGWLGLGLVLPDLLDLLGRRREGLGFTPFLHRSSGSH